MKRLLIVSETWYPDSRATIAIMERIAEGIAEKSVEVYALPLKPLADGKEYPTEYGGIKILSADIPIQETSALKWNKLLQKCMQKLLYAQKHLLVHNSDCRWNRWVKRLRDYERACFYQPITERIRKVTQAQRICTIIKTYGIDTIISVSLPFWIHSATALAVKMREQSNLAWVPISFDPYAYDESISQTEKLKRIKEEHRTFRSAKRVFMLSQSLRDYQTDSLLGKMSFFEIPNIRKIVSQNPMPRIQFRDGFIHCVFIGNLYWTVRNPEHLFKMFEMFKNDRICLHVIGSLSHDFPDEYISKWITRLGGRLAYHGRVSSEEATAIMSRADVLINIGNTTSNQCPSKVLEYISTGKPILSLSKIEKCTSEAYLKHYPLAFLIREQDCNDQDIITRAENFIVSKQGEQVEFEMVKSLFRDSTNEKVVEILMDAFG